MVRFDVDFTKLSRWHTPEDLRKPIFSGLLNALVSPVIYIYNSLVLYRKNVLYRLSVTPQVCYLEKLLNDRFDKTERRIFITDGNFVAKKYVYLKSELKPKYLYLKSENKPFYVRKKAETGSGGNDFVIHLPALSVTVEQEPELKALIERYKLVTKGYELNRF